MKAVLLFILTATITATLIGCGGGSQQSAPPVAQLTGSWEAVASSTQQQGYFTAIETNLTNGNASGQQIVAIVSDPSGNFSLGGSCDPTAAENFSSKVDANGNVTFTFSEGPYIFNGTGILSGSKLTGTYQGGGNCIDSGTFKASKVTPFSGSWVEYPLSCPDGFYTTTCVIPDVTLSVPYTLTEKSDYSVTADPPSELQTGSFAFSPLTGFVVGNAASVTGLFDGSPISVYAWKDWLYYFNASPTVGVPCIIVADSSNLIPDGIMFPAGTVIPAIAMRAQGSVRRTR
jgi:hypothetical protein